MTKKIEYVQPEILDLGPLDAIFGQDCKPGSGAAEDCLNGVNPGSGSCVIGSGANVFDSPPTPTP